MAKYREIIRLASLSLSQTNIALSCGASKKTVNKVLKAARKRNLMAACPTNQNNTVIEQLLDFQPNNYLKNRSALSTEIFSQAQFCVNSKPETISKSY